MSSKNHHPRSSTIIIASLLVVGGSFLPSAAVAETEPERPSLTSDTLANRIPHPFSPAVNLTQQHGRLEASLGTTSLTATDTRVGALEFTTNGTKTSVDIMTATSEAFLADDNRSINYQHANGDASVVNLTEDGGLRIVSAITSAASPTEWAYKYTGVRLELLDDGGVVGYGANDQVELIFDLPWAYDSAGREVPTRYAVNGNTVTQVIDHKTGDYQYPIFADPTSYGGNTMYRNITAASDPAGGDRVSVYVGTYNFSHASNDAIWASYRSLVPAKYEATTMKNQLICHARNIGALKNPWNLETRRPNVGYAATVAALCNPN